uniref:Uncharacterized protein n=1 Tax=Arundo donax TaxID=35708 RepID=A0A0A8ZFZ4_ARUDO
MPTSLNAAMAPSSLPPLTISSSPHRSCHCRSCQAQPPPFSPCSDHPRTPPGLTAPSPHPAPETAAVMYEIEAAPVAEETPEDPTAVQETTNPDINQGEMHPQFCDCCGTFQWEE